MRVRLNFAVLLPASLLMTSNAACQSAGLPRTRTVMALGTLSGPSAEREALLYRYDVRWHGDCGTLLVSGIDIRWQDFDRPDRSQTWPYNIIRDFQRIQAGHKVKLQSYRRRTYRFRLAINQTLTDDVYQKIKSRIAAARPGPVTEIEIFGLLRFA